MDLQNNFFYIVIQNRYYKLENNEDNYHLEKVFTKEEMLEIIEDHNVRNDFNVRYFIVITNDETFLNKYLFTINLDEFKMLCGAENYNEKNIRINSDYFFKFDEEVFTYFKKILNDEIISATMLWTCETYFPEYGDVIENFEGWIENKQFSYFKTPGRYRKTMNDDRVFSFKDYKMGNLELFKKLVNINILEIETDKHPSINWEWRNGLLRYYDKISSTRLYISDELLKALKDDNDINFKIQTKLDKNHYLEYYVIEIETPVEFDRDNDYEKDSDNENNSQYDKYNGAYGFDDDTIDSAFEGDPENYWNID